MLNKIIVMATKKIISTVKKPTSFSISDEAKRLLKLIAEKNNRSQANMLETLILNAAKAESIS